MSAHSEHLTEVTSHSHDKGAIDQCNGGTPILHTYLIDPRDPVIREVVWCSDRTIQDHTAVGREADGGGIRVYKRIEQDMDPRLLARYRERVRDGSVVRVVTVRFMVIKELDLVKLELKLLHPEFDGDKGAPSPRVNDSRPAWSLTERSTRY